MRKGILHLLCFMSSFAFAQTINQMDDNGKRHGIWKKNFDKTKVLRYEGEFLHGKEIGTFKFYKNKDNKAVLAASKAFNKNNAIAEVQFFSEKGKLISKGQMNGKIHIGTWDYYHERKGHLITKETYDANGLLQNERLLYYKDGVLAEKQPYKDGKLNGLFVWYSLKGKIAREVNYVNGEIHGPTKEFGPDGTLTVEGQYQHDRKHGIWNYYKLGKLNMTKDYTRRSKNPYKKKS